jgi:HEPN domain-containing protein
MKPIVAEWVAKAEGDFATFERERRARKNPNYDAACFHAQQCAEKYIKALLCDRNIAFGKVHDLVALLDSLVNKEQKWELFREDLAYLSDFAVAFRYPGDSADKETARDASLRCRNFRKAMRRRLGLQ